jgi:hypothetical protein
MLDHPLYEKINLTGYASPGNNGRRIIGMDIISAGRGTSAPSGKRAFDVGFFSITPSAWLAISDNNRRACLPKQRDAKDLVRTASMNKKK